MDELLADSVGGEFVVVGWGRLLLEVGRALVLDIKVSGKIDVVWIRVHKKI